MYWNVVTSRHCDRKFVNAMVIDVTYENTIAAVVGHIVNHKTIIINIHNFFSKY